jgi:hypothetical protein
VLSNFAEMLGLKLNFACCKLAREPARSIDFTMER